MMEFTYAWALEIGDWRFQVDVTLFSRSTALYIVRHVFLPFLFFISPPVYQKKGCEVSRQEVVGYES